MAKSDGPITEGIRRAIKAAMDSGMTAYRIAAEAGLSPSQLYRFLAEDPEKRRGLSLEALDGIAKALDLEIRSKTDMETHHGVQASQEPEVEVLATLPLGVHRVNNVDPSLNEDDTGHSCIPTLTVGPARRLEGTIGCSSASNQAGDSMAPIIMSPRRLMSLKDRIAAMKAEMGPGDVDDDEDPFADDEGITGGPPPPRPSEPDYTRRGDDYEPVDSTELRQMFGMPTINAREYPERNKYLVTKLDMNPGMKKLAEKYSKTAGSDGYEKAKFYHFVFQMIHQNPHAEKILGRVDGSSDLLDVDESKDQPHETQKHLA